MECALATSDDAAVYDDLLDLLAYNADAERGLAFRLSYETSTLSCAVCKRRKGSDISLLNPVTGALMPLFNPRTQSSDF